MLEKEKCLDAEVLYRGKVVQLRVETVQVQNGKTSKREIIEHCEGVCVVALDANNEIALVRQYRRPIDDFLLELPAGKKEAEEDSLTCAIRELKEETGLQAENYVYLGADYVSPGFCTEKIHVYLATGLTKGQAAPDEDEFVEVFTYPLDTLVKMVMDGEICDAKTAIGVLKTKFYIENKGGKNNE